MMEITAQPNISIELIPPSQLFAFAMQCRHMNEVYGVPILLRYAHEMNGAWGWGLIEVWFYFLSSERVNHNGEVNRMEPEFQRLMRFSLFVPCIVRKLAGCLRNETYPVFRKLQDSSYVHTHCDEHDGYCIILSVSSWILSRSIITIHTWWMTISPSDDVGTKFWCGLWVRRGLLGWLIFLRMTLRPSSSKMFQILILEHTATAPRQ